MHLSAEPRDAINISDHVCGWVLIIHKSISEQKEREVKPPTKLLLWEMGRNKLKRADCSLEAHH